MFDDAEVTRQLDGWDLARWARALDEGRLLDPARDGTYRVQGRIGEVVFEVRDGEVRCVSADCPDHVCVRSGTVRAGAPVVCAPNGVVAEFTGVSEGGAVDAVSR